MSYYYRTGPSALEIISAFVLAVLVVIMIVLMLVPDTDPVLSEQLDRYELDPTIVKIDTMTCEVNGDELRNCTVSIEAPASLISKARYVRLIDPDAEVAALVEEPEVEEAEATEVSEEN